MTLTPEKLESSGTVGRNSTTGADLAVSNTVSVPSLAPKHEHASRIQGIVVIDGGYKKDTIRRRRRTCEIRPRGGREGRTN